MLPFFQLSKHLARKGNRVSFVSTPRNISRFPKIPPDLAPLLRYVELPLPADHENLPDGGESTSDVPFDKVEYLKKAMDGLESSLANFLETASPDWIVYDFMHHWVPAVASKFDVQRVYFSIFTAAFLTFMGPPSVYLGGEYEGERDNPEDYTVAPPWVPFENNLRFRKFEIMKMVGSVHKNVTGVADAARFGVTTDACDIVAIRTDREFEAEWLELLEEKLYRKPVFPIGLLSPRVDLQEDDDNDETTQWLDGKGTKSVVYVAFGSEAVLSQEETTELALGLELSGLPFFWVLRTPIGAKDCELPAGFEDRVKGRGFIWRTWAPQLKILSHPSVGGFLTHSGWSSVIESLAFGCPLVLLPLINDQSIMARSLVWKKISFEIPRDESTGWFSRESVAESLRRLVVDEEGESYRIKAIQLKEIVGDTARQDKFIEELDKCLRERRHRNSKK